jgi:hypothetical protein
MSWTARSAPYALICIILLLLTSHRCLSQWFTGDLRDSTNRADYIIITSAAYANAVQPLVAFRANHQSLAVVTVLMDSITAQFPRATPDSSVRDFVTKTLTQWRTPRAQFLLLAGNVNIVPSHKVASYFEQYSGEDSVMIDQWLASGLTQSQECPTPGMAVGRFPAWTAGDLSTMVSKTLAYEQATTSGWAARSIVLADSADFGMFEADAADFQRHAVQRWHDTVTVHIRENSPAYKTRSQFLSLWSQGCAVVNFVGHMNGWQFSRDAYFTIRDIDSLATGSLLPFCLTAGSQRFERRDSIPIAVALLQASARGAVCMLAPSGLMYAAANALFTIKLFDYVSQHPLGAIGTAWLSVLQQEPEMINQRRTLFGDPALVIKSNPLTSVVDPGNGSPSGFALFQNYPNPFNPLTNIVYAIEGTGHEAMGTSMVKLSVYDILGRELAVLVNDRKEAGTYTVTWDGSGMATGVYVYRIQSGGLVQSRKMMLLK